MKKHNNIIKKNKIKIPYRSNLLMNLFLGFCVFLKDIYLQLIRGEFKKFRESGVLLFVGLPGSGKTLSIMEKVIRLRAKHGNKIYIIGNFKSDLFDYTFESMDDIFVFKDLCIEDKKEGLVIAIDEAQLQFSNRDFAKFPKKMLALLSYNRKFKTLLMIATQDYNLVDINLRRYANYVIEVFCLFKRFVYQKWYFRAVYESTGDTKDAVKKRRKAKSYSYICWNSIRNSYDTYEMVSNLEKWDLQDTPLEVIQKFKDLLEGK